MILINKSFQKRVWKELPIRTPSSLTEVGRGAQDAAGMVLVQWSLGGADWLEGGAGGGQHGKASPSCCRCCPLLDGCVRVVFIVESFDAIIEVVNIHLLHLNGRQTLVRRRSRSGRARLHPSSLTLRLVEALQRSVATSWVRGHRGFGGERRTGSLASEMQEEEPQLPSSSSAAAAGEWSLVESEVEAMVPERRKVQTHSMGTMTETCETRHTGCAAGQWGGVVDVDGVCRQGSSQRGQTTCHHLPTADQL